MRALTDVLYDAAGLDEDDPARIDPGAPSLPGVADILPTLDRALAARPRAHAEDGDLLPRILDELRDRASQLEPAVREYCELAAAHARLAQVLGSKP